MNNGASSFSVINNKMASPHSGSAIAIEFPNLYQQQEGPTHVVISQPNTPPPSYGEVPGVVPFHATTAGPPPTYDEANNPNAPPPTYESLFGRVREARKNSSGFFDFIKKVTVLILGTIGCTIAIGVTVVIPVVMIIMGSLTMHSCPVEPYIPIYLVVGGVFGALKNLMSLFSRCKKCNEEEEDEESLRSNALETVIKCFLFAWFIAGCVWVYRVYEPDFENVESPYYCDKTLYLFSFWLITVVYIIVGFCTLCLCCLGMLVRTVHNE